MRFGWTGARGAANLGRMWDTVEIPVWAVWLTALLAVVALLDRVIGPSVRWFFRRRVNRAIDRLNRRLHVHIQPFKLTKRQVLIDRLVYDPQVMEALDAHVAETGMPRDAAVARVQRYAREIVPSFSAYAYFGVGARISRWIAQALYRVRLGAFDQDALRNVDPQATVVFVMNHRSNVDYLLVTYLASTQSALSYAVGEWARVWPLSQIIRAMGAYFIRRKSRNALYRRVLARYVRMATDAGVTQAIFPEGGLSRDGRLGPPKLGLLAYILDGFDADGPRDVVFVPVGLNYDRVLEDRLLLGSRTAAGEQTRLGDTFLGFVRFLGWLAWMRVTGRLYRFGYACVSFGQPLSLKTFLRDTPEDAVAALGDTLTGRIGRVVPVLPVSLIARVLDGREGPISAIDLKVQVHAALEDLRSRGAHSHVPRADLDYAIEVGMRMLILRRIVDEDQTGYTVREADVLRYYANAIEHL